jgi:hypothetical protein
MSKRSQKIYCSNACQALVRREIGTKRWLESGTARIDSHQGHYIREYLAEAQSGCCAICGGANAWLSLPSHSCWTTSTATRRTMDGKTCG